MFRRAGVTVLAALALALAGCTGGATTAGGEAPGAAQNPAASAPGTSAATTAAPDPSSGTTAPVPKTLAFTAKTLDGADFAGASLAGRPAVLWFWAPWCTTCRADAAHVAKTAEKVTVIGVPGLSQDRGSMRGFVQETKTGGFTHLGDGAGDVWKQFGMTVQGTYVLLDSGGGVVFKGALDAAGLDKRVAALK